MELIGLLIGIGFIVIGAELFIRGLESVSINFKIPKIVIALTIIAFGTSAPELTISFQGLIDNNGELVLSNVIGSTIVNGLLVIGVASFISPIKVQNNTVKEELPLHLFIILIFVFLFIDSIFNNQLINTLSRNDGVVLLLTFLLFLYYLMRLMKKHQDLFEMQTDEPKLTNKKAILYSSIGLILIISGAKIAIDSATLTAMAFGWSAKVVTMIFIVIGTSVPELILSIVSARKKQYDFIIGNIIGTNIFNICIVLGLPILIFGSVSSIAFNSIDMFMLIAVGFVLFFAANNDKVISKKEGLIMIGLCCIYYGYILF